MAKTSLEQKFSALMGRLSHLANEPSFDLHIAKEIDKFIRDGHTDGDEAQVFLGCELKAKLFEEQKIQKQTHPGFKVPLVASDIVVKLQALFVTPEPKGKGRQLGDDDAHALLLEECLQKVYGSDDAALLIRPIAHAIRHGYPCNRYFYDMLWQRLHAENIKPFKNLSVLLVGIETDSKLYHDFLTSSFRSCDAVDLGPNRSGLSIPSLPEFRAGMYDVVVTGNVHGAPGPHEWPSVFGACAKALRPGGKVFHITSYTVCGEDDPTLTPAALNYTGLAPSNKAEWKKGLGGYELLVFEKSALRDITHEGMTTCIQRIESARAEEGVNRLRQAWKARAQKPKSSPSSPSPRG